MVSIGSPLNKDLDKYIAQRKRGEKRPKPKKRKPELEVVEDERESFWTRLFGARKAEEPPVIREDLTEDEMARLEAMQDSMRRIDVEEAEHPEAVDELEEVRESLLTRFFKFFRLYSHEHRLEDREAELAAAEEEHERLDEDLKLLLKGLHKWLERLSAKEKAAFKKSPEFQLYKETLERYGVAKKK